jgi:hypothetical protein
LEVTNKALEKNTAEVWDETFDAILELTHEKTISSKSSTYGMSGEPNDDSLGGEEDDILPLCSAGVTTW